MCNSRVFCTLDNLQDFKLDSPRTRKKQAAIVLISSVLKERSAEQPACFMVESVQLLQQDEVDKAKVFILTALTAPLSSRKRSASSPLTHDESPAKAAKCRVLGRHPASTSLPEFS